MSQEAINRTVRQRRRARQPATERTCSVCGATVPVGMKRYTVKRMCYECLCIAQGKTTVEDHHVLGQANGGPTIGLPGNVHQEVTDKRYDWPEDVRLNRERDPILWTASLVYAARDLCHVLTVWLNRGGAWLVNHAHELREERGERWWEQTGSGTPWKEGKDR